VLADEPTGREAEAAGTELGVWEIIRDYAAAGHDERAIRKSRLTRFARRESPDVDRPAHTKAGRALINSWAYRRA
jgi:hypothetical protein